jgi:hypothetical protein
MPAHRADPLNSLALTAGSRDVAFEALLPARVSTMLSERIGSRYRQFNSLSFRAVPVSLSDVFGGRSGGQASAGVIVCALSFVDDLRLSKLLALPIGCGRPGVILRAGDQCILFDSFFRVACPEYIASPCFYGSC